MSIETDGTLNVTCPHCGYEDKDSWEIDFGAGTDGESDQECGRCGEPFKAFREVSVTYSTRKKVAS